MSDRRQGERSSGKQSLVGLSPIDVVTGEFESARPDVPMQWSLGLLGDLMWMRLPETRPFLAQLMASTIESAINEDRELFLLPYDIVVEALWDPIMMPTLDGFPRTRDRLVAQLRVVREAYLAEYPGRDAINGTLEDYIFDSLRERKYWAIIEEVDPKMASLIESVYGK